MALPAACIHQATCGRHYDVAPTAVVHAFDLMPYPNFNLRYLI
jgi:hypothetical protein